MSDELKVHFVVDDEEIDNGMLAGSSPTVNGRAVDGFERLGNGEYAYTYTLSEGDTDRSAGTVPVSISVIDPSGNESPLYFSASLESPSLDANTPLVSRVEAHPSHGVLGIGDVLNISVWVADGSGGSAFRPALGMSLRGSAVNGRDVHVHGGSGGMYTLMYSVSEGDADRDEWDHFSAVGDDVLHVNLAKRNTVVLLAPLCAHSLAVLTAGAAPNLATSVFRAWYGGLDASFASQL